MRLDLADTLSEIMNRISGNPWIHLAELSAQIGIKRNIVQRIAKQETGMTFRQTRQACRLCHSLRLMNSGMSVKSAALTCGYKWSNDYSRAFKRYFAALPSALRQKQAAFHKRAKNSSYVLSDFSCPLGSNVAVCWHKVIRSSSNDTASSPSTRSLEPEAQ